MDSNSGEVGPEWRVRILPAGSLEHRPLTPDVAFFSNEWLATISGSSAKDAEYPTLAPDIAFEVISESDEKADIEAERADYLNAGAFCVVEVYAASRELRAWKAPDSLVTAASTQTWTDESFPGLAIHVADLFLQYDTFIRKLGD